MQDKIVMTQTDIQMCVADVMQDDEIENIDSIIRMLNNTTESSWRAARGKEFVAAEVVAAINELLVAGMVTPCADESGSGYCAPIKVDKVGTAFPIEALSFHLEQSGRDAVKDWWDREGHIRFPLDPA